jgi:hypothetical protein
LYSKEKDPERLKVSKNGLPSLAVKSALAMPLKTNTSPKTHSKAIFFIATSFETIISVSKKFTSALP